MSLLRERGFLLLWTGQFLNIIASWTLRTVLLIWVYTLTRSGVAVSLVGLAEALPLLVLAPISGVLVDRWNRAHTMAASTALSTLAILPMLAVNGRGGIPIIVVVAIAANSCGQLFMTAAAAAVPVVVGQERAGAANSLLSMLNGIVAVAGPAAAALAFSTIGPHGAVIACSALFALTAPVVFFIPAPRADRSNTAATSVMHEMRDGLRYVRGSSLLSALVAVSFVALLGIGALSVLDVVFVTRALHLASASVGVLYSASGVGELTGGVVMSVVGSRLARRYHQVLAWSIFVMALALIGYALSPTLWVAAGALLVVSLMFPPLIVAFMTMVQLVTDDAYMGRVNSVINTAIGVAMILSVVSAGALADATGVRQLIAGAAVIFGISGFVTLRTIRSTPDPRPVTTTPTITVPDCEGNTIRMRASAAE